MCARHFGWLVTTLLCTDHFVLTILQVMGSAAYLHNACVLICPFEGDKCQGAKHRLNRIGSISQLYSHWQSCHNDNKAARVLEARWRKVLAY